MPKTVLLTGASRGLGLATLEILLAQPANVVAVSRSLPPALEALQKQHANSLVVIQGDVADRSVSESAVEQAISKFGSLDGIILNAGVLQPLGRIGDVNVANWEKIMQINFFSLIHTIQLALPHLRKAKGTVVLVSSGAAEKGNGGWGAYASTKAAMNSLARTLGTEEEDVFTIAVRPGTVDTDMQADIRAEGADHMSAADYAMFKKLHTDKVLLAPQDPGHVLATLAVKGGKREWSGKFLSWNSDELADYQRAK